ncbi:MAG: sulfatase [Deltaproteobacteria bacterium]|nr:sulfatase [Deltaproteobacteria bacterium]
MPEDPLEMELPRPLLGLLFLALIGVGLYQTIEFRGPDRPMGSYEQLAEIKDRDVNLVVIMVDTLRADRLSSWGYERETSPVMDALAASGIRFANNMSQSTWTKTSMASIFTATYPAKNKVTRFNHVIPRGATLAPEILQDAGFRTVGIWRNGWIAASFGFDQGWDFYVKPNRDLHDQIENPSSIKLGGTDQAVTNPALQFLRSVGDERFFLYLHYMDAHQYVYDGAVDFGRGYSDIYDQSVHWVDANIGSVVAVLQQQGLMKNTVLAIISDHGEGFLEHGHEGHAANLYRETTHVPFILTLPFRLNEPIVVESPVENVDIMPTLFDLLGLPDLPEADGESLMPLVEAAARGEAEPSDPTEPRFAFLDKAWGRPNEDPRAFLLVEKDGYRLHDYAGAGVHLYDANEDYAEGADLAESDPERVKALRTLAREHLQTPAPSWGGPGWVAIDDMEAAQLRALGYAFDPHAPPAKRKLEP